MMNAVSARAMERLVGVAQLTLHQAGCGLVFAVGAAFLVFELRRRFHKFDFLYRPILLFAYSIPAFALSLFAGAAGFPESFDWLLVGLTLIIPLEMAIANGAAEADSLDSAGIGPAWRRLLHIRVPAMTPALLLGLALSIPWALLGAMLLEVVQGNDGLGQRLAADGQLGLQAQVPAVALLVIVSGGGFFCFAGASLLVRAKLSLSKHPPRATIFPPRNIEFGPASFLWGLLIIALSSWAMHIRYPTMVAAPLDLTPLRNLMPNLSFQVLQTLTSTLFGASLGILAGMLTAIASIVWPSSRRAFELLLLPLQIIPLQVFAPALLVFALATSAPIYLSETPPFGMDWPAVTVGLLASTYVTLQYLSAWLTILPGRTSGILGAHNSGNLRVIRFVFLPWLVRGAAAFLPAVLPRAVLAILVTEYLVTQKGLGGAIAQARGQRAFHETFVLVIVMITVVFTIHGAVTLYVSRISNSWRMNRV